jgi:hypothetical protein
MHGAHTVGRAYKCGPQGPFPLVASFVAGDATSVSRCGCVLQRSALLPRVCMRCARAVWCVQHKERGEPRRTNIRSRFRLPCSSAFKGPAGFCPPPPPH